MSASPDNDLPVQPGSVLAGKYRVERVIGRGGMGVVVVARHVALDERVALKFLLPEFASHPEASERFQREARAAVKIKGEHVARVSDVGTLESGSPYMVMEFLEGIDLSQALQKYGVCQVPDAIDYILQASEAIAEAHGHGIIHRDLKPANMFLTRRHDGTPMVKVLDFGISKMSGGGVDNLTRTTTSMGSALYMSPEQMQQTRGVDNRTDVYALGISLYELLAGKQPFYADTLPQLCAEVLTGVPTPIRQLRPEVPEGLGAALEKAYARDKEQRYQSIADLAAGLAPWAPARSQSMLDRIARMAGQQPAVAGAAPRALSQSNPALAFGAADPSPGFSASGANPSLSASGPNPALSASGLQPAVAAQTGISSQTGGLGPAQSVAMPDPSIAIGGYHAPVSVKAAAAFAAGASTNTNLSATSGLSRPPPGKAWLALGAVAFLVLLAAGGVVLMMRGRGEPQAVASPGDAPGSAVTSSTATAPAPPPTTSATATAEPAPTSTAAATAAATSEPAPTTTASVAPTAVPSTKPKPTSKPVPTVPTKKPGVMTSR